ncbi:hypothetical protein Tco_0455140 [Tanacetum coccineum]
MLPRVHYLFLLWERCNQAAKSRYNTRIAQFLPRHIYSPCVVDWKVLNQMGCGEVIDEMLTIKLCVVGTDDEIFTSEVWTRAFNIEEPIYSELCHEFDSTYEFDEFCADDELRTKRIIKFRLCGRAFSWTLQEFAKRALDTTTLKELIDSKGRLIPKVLEPSVPRVAIPRAHRASLQDLYESMGSIEIRQGAIERMSYRQSYQWDKYVGVFEHMAGVYDVPLQGAYNPPRYDQQQYEQYYQQYLPK